MSFYAPILFRWLLDKLGHMREMIASFFDMSMMNIIERGRRCRPLAIAFYYFTLRQHTAQRHFIFNAYAIPPPRATNRRYLRPPYFRDAILHGKPIRHFHDGNFLDADYMRV